MPVVFKRKLPCELSRVPYLVTPLSDLKGDMRPDKVWFPGGFVLHRVSISYKVYKLAGPQRQGVESCRILTWISKTFEVKKYAERLILTAVKEGHRRRNTKVKNVCNKKLPDISVCKTNPLRGPQE